MIDTPPNTDLKSVNVTVDQITGGYQLLRRFDLDTEKLTELTVITAQQQIPDSTSKLRYEALPLDALVGEKCENWDGASPITLFFNSDGHFDHYEKTGIATAASAV